MDDTKFIIYIYKNRLFYLTVTEAIT